MKIRKLVFKKFCKGYWESEYIFGRNYEIRFIILDKENIIFDREKYIAHYEGINLGEFATYQQAENVCNEHFSKEISKFLED